MANGDVYIKSAGVLTKIGSGFDYLSDTDKIALFNQAADDQTLNEQDVLSLGKFEVFAYAENSNQQTVSVKALPLPKTMLPAGLIPKAFKDLLSIRFSGNFEAASGASIKIFFTTDNLTYKIFDGSAWQTITDYSLGMTKAQVEALTAADFALLMNGAAGFGTGFYLEQNTLNDGLYIEKMSLTVNMLGSWQGAKHGIDYELGFYGGGLMKVKLLTAGTYKINYDDGQV